MNAEIHKPASRTIPSLLREIAVRLPAHEALVDGNRRWTYDQLLTEVETVAKAMLAHGIEHGDRVGILAGNRAEWLLAHFAISSVGAVSVGLNTWATAKELAYQLQHAGVKLLLVEPQFKEQNFLHLVRGARQHAQGLPKLISLVTFGEQTNADYIGWQEFLSVGEKITSDTLIQATAKVVPHDIACMLYTSGSTALPKGVPLAHQGLIDNMWEIGERQHLCCEDRLWLAVSLFWSFASVNAVFALLTHQATIVLQHHFRPQQALELIAKERCTVFYGTPNIVQALIDEQSKRPCDIGSLRTGLTLGTPAQIVRAAELGIAEICNVYGLTEAYGNTTVTDSMLPLEVRAETVGEVLPGQQVRIVEPDSNETLAPMNTGEIHIRGNVTTAYWDAPEQNSAAFTADGWFRTGDLGYLDDKGFLYYRGRLKEMIKSGGINVSPAEVEQILGQHPKVELALVTSVADPVLDEKVVAVIVLKEDQEVDVDDLVNLCRQSLASYKTPRDFRFVKAEALPLTSTGKLQRQRLAALFQ